MELVVVLVILVALGGILIPLLPSMITKAHTSTAATNAGEISKIIQTYQSTYLGYPDKLDSILTTTGSYPSYVPGGGGSYNGYTHGTNPDLTTLAVSSTSPAVSALNGAGIVNITPMVDATAGGTQFSPTFYPYADPTAPSTVPTTVPVTSMSALLALTPAAAAREFGASASVSASYVILGIGKYSTLSKVMQEAPVHFDDSPSGSPSVAYARYGAVFQVTDPTTGNALDSARLLGVVGFHEDQVSGIGDHLAEYWNSNK
jgi:type II secretory pathway pseudopilin PulG